MIKGSGVFFLTKILGILSIYLFSWYLSIELRAEAYGRFAYLFTLINVITVFTIFGFDATLIKYFSAYSKERNLGKIKSIYLESLKLSIPFSIIVSLILIGIVAFYFQDKEAWSFQLMTVAIIVPAFTLFQINNAAISGLKQMTVYSLFKNVFLVPLAFILTLFFSFRYLSISYAVIAFCLATYIGLFFNTLYLLKKIKFFNTPSIPSLNRNEILKIGLPMLLTTATSLLITSIDILMLGFFKTTFEVGIYDIAIKFSILAGIALLGINAIATPKFSEFYSSKDFKGLKRIVRWSSKFIFWTTIPVLMILIFFPKQLLSIYGEEFTQASSALVILALGQLVSSLSGSVGNILKMTDHHKLFQFIMIGALLLNICLNVVLIPIYGIVGAAIATSSSIAFYNLMGVFFVYKKLNLISFYFPFLTR
jgi:O-antigen/teichoic acid export membrane protein